MYKAKITIDLTFSQFAQSKNYLDDTVPYYKYESNGLTTLHIFGQTMQEILTHTVFNDFSNILEVLITFKSDHDYCDPMPNMHDCDGIFLDAGDPDYESSENTLINHTSDW